MATEPAQQPIFHDTASLICCVFLPWLFSTGPTGEGDPVTLMKGWRFPEAQQPIADRIRPRDIGFFGGEIDMQKLNLAEKLIVKGIKAPVGDFRDWDAIAAWAAAIADALQKEA